MYLKPVLSIIAVAILIVSVELSKNKNFRKPVLLLAVMLYLAGLIYVVGFRGARSGLSRVSIKLPLPFWRAIKARHYGLVTNRSMLNVLLFVPFGYLLPHIINWKDGWKEKWWMVALAGLFLSLFIETSQLIFRFGAFELDDLVKNTMGAGIGYFIYSALDRFRKRGS